MISLKAYPGLQGMTVLQGSKLCLVDKSGGLTVDEPFNQRFAHELSIFQQEYRNNMRAYCLGWILPAYPKSGHMPWTDSSSLFFSRKTLLSLETFEKAAQRFSSVQKTPRFLIDEEMSVYEGMKRLCAYGLVLGFYPAITLGPGDELAVVNIHIRNKHTHSEIFHNALTARVLNGPLFNAGTERGYLHSVLAEIAAQDESYAFPQSMVG